MNNSDQRIQDYIDGLLPADEKLAFEEKLKVDSDLQANFQEQVFLNKALKEQKTCKLLLRLPKIIIGEERRRNKEVG